MTQQEGPPPLEYRPRSAEEHAGRLAGQAIAGALLTAAILVGVVFASVFLLLTEEKQAIAATVIVAAGVALLTAITLISVRLYRNPRRRGWAIGIWIGVGLAMLIEGICYREIM